MFETWESAQREYTRVMLWIDVYFFCIWKAMLNFGIWIVINGSEAHFIL